MGRLYKEVRSEKSDCRTEPNNSTRLLESEALHLQSDFSLLQSFFPIAHSGEAIYSGSVLPWPSFSNCLVTLQWKVRFASARAPWRRFLESGWRPSGSSNRKTIHFSRLFTKASREPLFRHNLRS